MKRWLLASVLILLVSVLAFAEVFSDLTVTATTWLRHRVFLGEGGVHIEGSDGGQTMGFDITGVQLRPGQNRTGIILRPPSEAWNDPGAVTEVVIVGKGDGNPAVPSHGLDVGWRGYGYGYNLFVESGGGAPVPGILFGIADHFTGPLGNTGTNRLSMEVIGIEAMGLDPRFNFGTVAFGRYAAKSNEILTDYSPINIAVFSPPGFNDHDGREDSHAAVWIAHASQNGAANSGAWRTYTRALDNFGASQQVWQTQKNAGSPLHPWTDRLGFTDTDVAGSTSLIVSHNQTMKRIEVGDADSCGAGYRCLRIPN